MRTLIRLIVQWLSKLFAPRERRPRLDRPRPGAEYAPRRDGQPDPGEVVWAWVAYEDDPSQGKDRPVLVVSRRGGKLRALALTSRASHRGDQLELGTGPWDSQGRTSYVKLDRVIHLEVSGVRREGAALDRARFDRVVAALDRAGL